MSVEETEGSTLGATAETAGEAVGSADCDGAHGRGEAQSNAEATPTSRQDAVDAVERRGFEELVVGETFELPQRTLTSEHFTAFQALTGDDHPMHYDVAECQRRGHADLLAHGLGVTALGAAGAGLFPYVVEDVMLGFLEQSSRFLRPVLRGDTLDASLEITELIKQRTTGVVVLRLVISNQRGEQVLEGEHRYLLRLAAQT